VQTKLGIDMRFFSTEWKNATQAGAGHIKEIEYDFLKMLAAAIATGITFSLVAASVALILTHTSAANAAISKRKPQPINSAWIDNNGLWILKVESRENVELPSIQSSAPLLITSEGALDRQTQVAPGNLYLGDGCGSTPLLAAERDWQVTVKGDIADIQVMQTFMIKSDDVTATESAYFHAVLPRGAQYASFRVQTGQHDLLGQYASGNDWSENEQTNSDELKTKGLVRLFEYRQPDGFTTLSSDTFADLSHDELVIVTYRYQVPITSLGKDLHALQLMLTENPTTDDQEYRLKTGTRDTKTNVSVWVSWADRSQAIPSARFKQPTRIVEAPRGLVIEHTPTSKRNISAVSWENKQVTDGQFFQLRWAK
jgi:hypothetical protein